MKYNFKHYEDFYLKNLPGPHGLTFLQSLRFEELDNASRHDYFQRLFPLPIDRSFNKHAQITEKITYAAEVYLSYLYVLRDCKKVWPNPTNHNNLRIARVLKCLKLLNQTPCANFIYINLMTEHKKNKDLTINNMDHFRSAMFNKTFFVVTKDDSRLRSIISSLLPDHDLMTISESEISDFTNLAEPVLNTIKSPKNDPIDSDILQRGKEFCIDLENQTKLEKYFMAYRFWY